MPPEEAPYEENERVTITAISKSDYKFTVWEVCMERLNAIDLHRINHIQYAGN